MADITQLQTLFSRLKEHVEKKDYEAAKAAHDEFSDVLRSIDFTEIDSLSKTQRDWLKSLPLLIEENVKALESDSTELTKAIAPFNKNSSLVTHKGYQR